MKRTIPKRAIRHSAEGARGGRQDGRLLAQARDIRGDPLQLESKYGGTDVLQAKRPNQLEDENAKLKKVAAEAMLDASALSELQ